MSWLRLLWNNFVVRPWKNYNISARAEKALREEKRPAAPLHPGSRSSEIPSDISIEDFQHKDEQLHDMVSGLIVNPGRLREPRPKNLPQSRDPGLEAFLEHTPTAREGHLTMESMLMLLSQHQYDSKKFSLEKLSAEYNIDMRDLQKFVKHYSVFMLNARMPVPSEPAISPTLGSQKQLKG